MTTKQQYEEAVKRLNTLHEQYPQYSANDVEGEWIPRHIEVEMICLENIVWKYNKQLKEKHSRGV